MKIAAMLLIGLALLGSGCASPGTIATPAPARSSEQLSLVHDDGADTGPLWQVGYWMMYFSGEALAGH